MDGWLIELAAELADTICPGIQLDERVVFDAIRTELTVEAVLEFAM
jgi:hypothetical protein